ncbi:transposase (plasmid) [Pseudarthrobacter phenanthrenivorans Sphe3]|uniref:Mutator family transposase n=1 Tax=Pseudarthrobacter phenanthrenivorans (strain DSM 18606 / JCM 16027 / LMG 23796 / Sphe3) TaxID=930171 RepID=F0MC28_PSEPM|nr:transposase [Pseudarthrobacter phenanthrenivorans Sphe3]
MANRPIYAAIGVILDGEKDILGLWAGAGGEGAKFWMSVLTDIKNRGVKDSFFLVCDGLKGLPEVVGNVWPLTTVQTCIIHLIRNTFRLASKKDWDALKRDVKPIYTAVKAAAAMAAFEELTERWGKKYGAIVRLWENAWEEFIPFLDYGACRRMACPSPGGDEGPIGRGKRRRAWPGTVGASGRCRVNLPNVVGGGREVQLASGCVEASAGESAQDRLEGADAGFDGCAPALVCG